MNVACSCVETLRMLIEEWLRVQHAPRVEFARVSTVPQNVIGKWLNGDVQSVSAANLRKVAPVLGLTYEELLREMGELPHVRARARVSARRQAIRDQLDRWMAAVGADYEDDFWDALKAQGDSTVALITTVGTAVKSAAEAPLSTGVNAQHPSRTTSRHGTGSRLRPAQRCAKPQLTPRIPHPGYPQTPLRPPLHRLTPLHS
jgi:transcriptional regulator with XRE-family HTH domain